MTRTADLGSLPPELIYEIVKFLGQGSLSSVARCCRFLHTFTSDLLYRRDAVEDKSYGLVRCIRSGATESVTKFIAVGVDVNTTINSSPDLEDFTGNTTLLATAVVRNQIEIVRLLLSYGADPCAPIDATLCYSVSTHGWDNDGGTTPLSLAISEGHTGVAVALIDHVGNPDAIICTKSDLGYTALEQAALCLRPSVVRRLLERGADPNHRTPGDYFSHGGGKTVLYRVITGHGLQRWTDGTSDEHHLIARTIMTLLMAGANPALLPYLPRQPHELGFYGIDTSRYELGIKTNYQGIRQHFAELAHRRLCENLACREHRYDYGVLGQFIPGHCDVSPDGLTAEELRVAESFPVTCGCLQAAGYC